MSIIVIGAGDIGYHVARRLSMEKKDVTVIDRDADRIAKISDALDVQTMRASGSSLSALQQAGIAEAEMVISVTNSDEVNLVSCMVASAQSQIPTKVARVKSLEYVQHPDMLTQGVLNVDLIINPDLEAVHAARKLLSVPGATDVVDFDDGRVKLIGCKVRNPIFYDGIRLDELQNKSHLDDIVITAIYRDSEVIIPQGRDKIYFNDALYAITSEDNIHAMINFFGREALPLRKAMIVGGGDVGTLLAHELEAMKVSTKLIDSDEERCFHIAEQLDRTVVLHHGGEFEELLSEEYIEDIDIFIAVTDDEEDNILLSLLAKQKGAKRAMAMIHNMTYTQLVSSIGVDLVINPNLCAINRILHFIRKGKVLSVASFYERNAEAIEAVALETSDLVNVPLHRLRLPKHAIIGAIVRSGQLIVPRGDTVILPDDHVVIFALADAVPKVEKMLMVKLEYW